MALIVSVRYTFDSAVGLEGMSSLPGLCCIIEGPVLTCTLRSSGFWNPAFDV